MNEENLTNEQIWSYFTSRIDEIKLLLNNNQVDIKLIKLQLNQLQTYITSKVSQIPAYDVRRTQEIIEEVNKLIQNAELALNPKKKFTFSSKSKIAKSIDSTKSNKQDSNNTESISTHSNSLAIDSLDNSKILKGLNGESLSFSNEINGFQLLISDCKDTNITVYSLLDSIRIERCERCVLALGPCKTSTYLDTLTDCILFVSCHQLRIHNCYSNSLYVRVNSHPIIEDCSNLGFAPYSFSYPDIELHFKEASLIEANNWDNVVDFRWHKSTQSPNWFIILEKDRKTHVNSCIKTQIKEDKN